MSCTVLTTAASDGLTWLHKRMPVVLGYDRYDLWLDRSTPDIADLTELLVPYPADELEVFPVSTRVNRTDMDEPGLIEAVVVPPRQQSAAVKSYDEPIRVGGADR